MEHKKKLLIISCSTGSGHGRAAEALRLTCQKNYPDVQVLHIDFDDYSSWIAHFSIVNSYNFFISKIPKLFGFIYKTSDNIATKKILALLRAFLRLGVKKFLKKIEEYQPDYIISTHFLPQLVLPKKFAIPFDVVITDYHAHQIWIAPNVRKFFVSTEEVKNDLEKIGVKSIVSGLPVHPRFFRHRQINELKKQLTIDNDWPIILMMPIYRGNISAKEAVTTIFSYNRKINLVAISGKNNNTVFKELEKIKSAGQKNFIILKNSNNIDEWMRVADIIVSKAGGLTISECMYLKKPIVIINPIPGQEEYNSGYIVKNGLGYKANSSDDLARNIQKIISDPTIIKTCIVPNASEIILEEVFKN